MKVIPTRNLVFVRRDKKDAFIKGSSLYMPDLYQREQSAGIVVGVGESTRILNNGDHVIFPDRNAQYLDILGTEIIVVEEEEVLCILED